MPDCWLAGVSWFDEDVQLILSLIVLIALTKMQNDRADVDALLLIQGPLEIDAAAVCCAHDAADAVILS